MTVEDLPGYLKTHWPTIRAQLFEGSYRPSPVLRKEIPKPGGGVRELGIPTVLDRLIQQALLQVLQREWDGTFSRFSFGYRPRRPLRDLEKWIRRRLRCYAWKQWGRRGYRELRRRGVSCDLAWNTSKSAHGPWRLSQSPALGIALPARYFRRLGLPSLVDA